MPKSPLTSRVETLEQKVDTNEGAIQSIQEWRAGNGTSIGAERRIQAVEEVIKKGECKAGEMIEAHVQDHKIMKSDGIIEKQFRKLFVANVIAICGVLVAVVIGVLSIIF
jgi:hypothetical protein